LGEKLAVLSSELYLLPNQLPPTATTQCTAGAWGMVALSSGLERTASLALDAKQTHAVVAGA